MDTETIAQSPTFGGAAIDLLYGTITWNEQTAFLTKAQTRILERLMRSVGHPVSRESLIEHLYAERPNYEPEGADVVLRQQIMRLRRQLASIAAPLTVTTRAGWGYGLEIISIIVPPCSVLSQFVEAVI